MCKADLSSQEQAMQEMQVVKDARRTEMENTIEKVNVCAEINSVSNKTNSGQM